jgi:hypothetical protein
LHGGGLPDKGKSRTLVNLSYCDQPTVNIQQTAITTHNRNDPLAMFIYLLEPYRAA